MTNRTENNVTNDGGVFDASVEVDTAAVQPRTMPLLTKNRAKRNKMIFIWGMLALPIINWLVFFLYVNIQSITLAFTEPLTREFTFDNFVAVWELVTAPVGNTLGISIKNTLKYFFNMVLVNTPLCLLIAYFFYKKIAGYGFFRIIFYLPAIVPGIAYVSAVQDILSPYGILKPILGSAYPDGGFFASPTMATNTMVVYCIYTGLTTNVLLFTSAMSRIPVEVLESARLEGIGPAKELALIVFPLIWPTFSTQLIFMMTGLFSATGPVLLFMGDGGGPVSTIAYWIFNNLYGSHGGGATPKGYANVATLGLCLSAVLVPIILFTRWLVERIEPVEY